MAEIAQIADAVTVLRDGKYVGTLPAAELDEGTLISMMVGRTIESLFPEASSQRGEVLLSIKNMSVSGQFHDISFDLHAGEVLGLAGLMLSLIHI